MAWTCLSKTLKQPSGGDNITSNSIDTTGADLLVACVADYGGNYTPTDSESNTWTQVLDYPDINNYRSHLYYAIPGSKVSASHVFYLTNGGTYPVLFVAAFSGASATQPDVDNQNTSSSTSIQPGSVTPTETGALIVTGFTDNLDGAISIDNSFVYADMVVTKTAGVCVGGGLAYLFHTSGAINPTWSYTEEGYAAAKIVVFNPAATGASTFVPRIIMIS